MIHVITASNRHEYEDILEQHFKLRHDIFVEERGWKTLARPDGREIDAYDNDDTVYLLAIDERSVVGGHRLYPTTKATMLGDVFPHLADVGGIPRDPSIWEWSRYFIVKNRRDSSLNLQLMAAVQELCLHEGITCVSAIMETWWLPRFQQAGFNVRPLGLPALVENAWTLAGLIEISADSLEYVKKLGKIEGPLLVHEQEPTLLAAARTFSMRRPEQ